MGVKGSLSSKPTSYGTLLLATFMFFVIIILYIDKRNHIQNVKKRECVPKTKTVTVLRQKIVSDTVGEFGVKKPVNNFKPHDSFLDIIAALNNSTDDPELEMVIVRDPPLRNYTTLGEISGRIKKFRHKLDNLTNLEKFHLFSISENQTYRENDPLVPLIIKDLSTLPIIGMSVKRGGTQIKLKMRFPHKIKAMFKPMRFPRDKRTEENHFYFTDYERHHSEIAAFHLDRALGFRRALPAVGRKINMTQDIQRFAKPEFYSTFFTSFSNRTCFTSNCMYYCNIYHPICADDDGMIEGSFVAFLPTFKQGMIREYRSPWRRSYSAWHKAKWEEEEDYCDGVKVHKIGKGRQLLDFIDLGVFDFIMGNSDRHSFGYFKIFGNTSAPMIYDNGRGFGDPFKEDYTIISSLMQCCIIREGTVRTLIKYQNGLKRLSEVMRASLATDPLSPVLWEPYYEAMDRRVELLLMEIRKCLKKPPKPKLQPKSSSSIYLN